MVVVMMGKRKVITIIMIIIITATAAAAATTTTTTTTTIMIIIIIIIVIMMMIIIIAFKGAIRESFYKPLQHVRSNGQGAVVCKSRATHRSLITCKCHVTCHLVRRGSSTIKFDRV